MWGIIYEDASIRAAVEAKLKGAQPGQLVFVPAPTWLLFELTSMNPSTWPAHLTMVPGRVVIPLRPFASATQTLPLSSTRFPSLSTLHLKYTDSVFQPAYCVTIHKLQGVTAHRVVADLHHSRALVTQSVIVVLSRVRRAQHLRLVPCDLTFLRNLRHDPNLTAFVSCLTTLVASTPTTPLPVCMFDLTAYQAFCAHHQATATGAVGAKPRPQAGPTHRAAHRDAGARK